MLGLSATTEMMRLTRLFAYHGVPWMQPVSLSDGTVTPSTTATTCADAATASSFCRSSEPGSVAKATRHLTLLPDGSSRSRAWKRRSREFLKWRHTHTRSVRRTAAYSTLGTCPPADVRGNVQH